MGLRSFFRDLFGTTKVVDPKQEFIKKAETQLKSDPFDGLNKTVPKPKYTSSVKTKEKKPEISQKKPLEETRSDDSFLDTLVTAAIIESVFDNSSPSFDNSSSSDSSSGFDGGFGDGGYSGGGSGGDW